MDIIILANYTMDFSASDNGRFSYLANLLARDGHDVEVVTSDFYHITKKKRTDYPDNLSYKVTFLDEPGYPKNICIKRFRSHKVWADNVKQYLSKRKKPDVIYSSIPSLDAPYWAARYCEKNNIRFVIDVQDLWPEAFQMVVNIPVISGLVFYPFKAKANGIYKRADAICAVSDTYCQRAAKVNKKVKNTTTVFLGTELATFDRYAYENPILEKKAGEVWLAYCGTLGSSYDLTCVIDALEELDDDRVRFIVMGDGPLMEEFKKHAKEKNVNAEFVGRLNYNAMCSLLKACDITVNPIAHMAAQSIINKHAAYVASGLPIVSTQENEEFRKLVDEYQMGFNCRNNDSTDLAEKIKRLVDDDQLRKQMGCNARRCAEEKFDRKNTYRILEQEVLRKSGGYCGLVKMPQEVWLGYAGTLGTSYDLPLVFDATRNIQNTYLRFIVMGDGPLKDEFERAAQGLNVTFVGRLPYEQMCGVLSACDIVVNPIVGSSAATIINKHADYAACGKPVVNTQKSEEYCRLIEKYEMGYSCNNDSELAETIEMIISNRADSLVMGKNARRCAEEKFDRNRTYTKIEDLILMRNITDEVV